MWMQQGRLRHKEEEERRLWGQHRSLYRRCPARGCFCAAQLDRCWTGLGASRCSRSSWCIGERAGEAWPWTASVDRRRTRDWRGEGRGCGRRARAAEAADGFCLGAWATGRRHVTAPPRPRRWSGAGRRRFCGGIVLRRLHHARVQQCIRSMWNAMHASLAGTCMHGNIYIGFLHYPCIGLAVSPACESYQMPCHASCSDDDDYKRCRMIG